MTLEHRTSATHRLPARGHSHFDHAPTSQLHRRDLPDHIGNTRARTDPLMLTADPLEGRHPFQLDRRDRRGDVRSLATSADPKHITFLRPTALEKQTIEK